MRNILFLLIATFLSLTALAQIDNAQYDAATGLLKINGSGFSPGQNVYPDSITIMGLNSVSYTLTIATPTVTPSSSTVVNLTLEGIDRAYMNALFDQDGTLSSNSEYYLLDVADGWNGSGSTAETADTITVSNYSAPTIQSATYDAATGILVVSGEGFASDATPDNDIDPTQFEFLGEALGTASLASTLAVEVTSHNEFTLTLSSTDKTNIDALLNINGIQSNDGTVYNIAASENWNVASNGTDSDSGPNAITVTNVPLIVNASVSDNEICEGETVTLSANPSGGDGSASYNFSWTSNPTGFNSTDENPDVSPTVSTTYTVEVSGGGTETSQVSVTVHPKPTLTSSVVSNPICSGSEFIYVPSSNQDVTTFAWSRASIAGIDEVASTGTGNIVETLTNTSTALIPVEYSMEMTTSQSCSNTETFTVDVNASANVDAIANIIDCEGITIPQIDFSTQSTDGTTTYNWTNNNTSIGLDASSTGSIAEFTAENTGTEPEVAFVSVTPRYTNGGKTCQGPAKSFTITVNPNGQVNAITDQTICNNTSSAYVHFSTTNTVGNTTYSWTNSETTTGLAASGIGDILSFNATNAGTAPLVASIQVTPSFTYQTKACEGASETFSIIVNPQAQVNNITDQKVCNGNNVAAIAFSSINTGGTLNYNWTNDNSSIGLALNGTGDIATFEATNASQQPQTANISVTPEFTNAGKTCSGAAESFTILVNPNGQVNAISDQLICEGEQSNYVNFKTTNTIGTTAFSWTNSNSSVGLTNNGTGDIASFTTTNGSYAPIVANIEVTPEFSYNAKNCPGTPEAFSYTINPEANVNPISNMVFCNGEATGNIVFTTSNTGGTPGFTWTNSNTSIGLSAMGSGAISSFNVVNSGNYPVVSTITVTPTYDNGGEICTGSSQSFTITVNPNAQVNPLSDITICNAQRVGTISFSTANILGTTQYNWVNDNTDINLSGSGTGNIGSFIATNGTQTPLVANLEVTPSYTYNGKTCSGSSESFKTTVNPTPNTSFTMPQTTYGNDAVADTIHGAIPYGGIFYGPGVIAADSTFHPTSAGVGSHTISYVGTNGYGCKDTATALVSVVPPGGTISGLSPYYCDYSQPDTIRGIPDTGGSLLEPGTGFTAIPGLEIINDSVAVVHPSLMTGTNIPIKFTYYKGALFDVITTTTIHEVVGTAAFSGLAPGYCLDDDAIQLNGTPSGGVFFGMGINANQFNPTAADVGVHQIGYTYSLGATGCRDTAILSTEVSEPPTASFTADSLYCSNIAPVQLIGEPAGGLFSGPNLFGTDTVLFSPNPSIVGPNTIKYTYIDGNGCSNSYEKVVRVAQVATVGIQAINDNYCVNSDSVLLKGEILGIFEGLGEFSGVGVNNNLLNDGIGYFRPDMAGAGGPYQVTFTYVDENSCVSTFSRSINVRELPTVSINNVDDLYCVNSPATEIIGVPQGASGSFSYTGNPLNLNDLNDGTALFSPTQVTESDFITYSYTDAFGCTNTFAHELEVVELPTVSFDSEELFCPNGSAVEIIGVPAGGFFTGPNISGTDTIIFSPSPSIIGVHNLVYTYSDSNMCTNSFTREIEIQELPTVGIVGLANNYCVNSDSALLTATTNGTPSSVGNFSGQGVFDEIPDDGQAYFIPAQAGVGGPYDIQYTFESSNNCLAIANKFTLVRDLPTVSISSPSKLFCEGEGETTITGIPQSSNGTFSYNGAISNLIDLGNGTAAFYPNNVIDNGIISYKFVDQYGCENSFNDTVKVSALPDVAFTMSSSCMADTVYFENQTISAEPVASWNWDFGDPASGNNTSNDENPYHYYNSSGDRVITLSVNTMDGCSDVASEDVEIGDAPEVDFSWENECFGSLPTLFFNHSDDTTSVHWNFGDGTFSENVSPLHTFSAPGSYPVTMQVTNQFGCSRDIIKTVVIRPFIYQFPYQNDFEISDNGWSIDINAQNNSWELGDPNGTIINSAFSGENSWATGLVNSYQNNEKSSVVSPCYDFTSIEKPMVKMQVWSSTQAGVDGAVLQAKIDGNTDWFNIGDLNDVINWYNGVGLQGNPGGIQNVGSYGWTGIETQWKEVRHELDVLKGKTNVRFRIAFGSDASGTSDGFAFDDIWIGERTKRILAESFTNSSDNNCAAINQNFNSLVTSNASDVIDIQYHTSFPDTDPFNDINPNDVAARTAYYGITEVPWAIFDGNIYSGNTSDAIDNYKLIEEQSLLDPMFAIDLETTTATNQLNMNIDVTSNKTLSGKNLTLHTIIIESEVSSITGTNGETQFFSVMRKMLPNAGGTILNNNWTIDQTESFAFNWDYASAIDPEKIHVIVFIQDEDTRKIYQAATDDTTSSTTSLPQIMIDFANDPFILYPNPAETQTNVLFNQPTRANSRIDIVDITGKLTFSKQLPGNILQYSCDLSILNSGIYLVRITNPDGHSATKRLIIKQ